jgi:hypothetical protein
MTIARTNHVAGGTRVTRRGARRAARGFTLIEAMLATLLGLMIIGTIFALLFAIQRVERNSRVSYQQAIDMAATQKALQRAFRQVVVSDGARPAAPGEGGTARIASSLVANSGGAANGESTAGSTAATGNTGGRPASSLFAASISAGPSGGAASSGGTGGGGGGGDDKGGGGGGGGGEKSKFGGFNGRPTLDPEEMSTQPRINLLGDGGMEILVAEPPLAIPGGLESGLQFAMTRGAFVIRPREVSLEEMTRAAAAPNAFGARVGEGTGPDLVWEVYPLGDKPEGPDAGDRAIGRVTLCRNVSSMKTQFYRTNQETQKLEAVSIVQVTEKRELPAYAEVQLTLEGGRQVRWLFEIGWTTGVEPRSSTTRFGGLEEELPAGEGAAGASGAAGERGRTSSGFSSGSSRGARAGVDKEANRDQLRGRGTQSPAPSGGGGGGGGGTRP